MAVHAQRFADRSDLVGKGHLQRVERVAGVLDHFGFLDPDLQYGRGQMGVEPAERRGGVFVIRADQGERRVVEVVDRGAFAQEFRIDGHAEVTPRAFPRIDLEGGNDCAGDRPRQHRAANGHNVIAALDFERRADLLADALDITQVETAVVIAGGADAHQREIGSRDRGGDTRRRPEPSIFTGGGDKIPPPRFDDGAAAAADDPPLQGIRINADPLMPRLGKACRRNTADVTQTEYAQFHQPFLHSSLSRLSISRAWRPTITVVISATPSPDASKTATGASARRP